MNRSWPTVALGDVITRVERFEDRDDFKTYRFAGTYSYAKGVFVGENKSGSNFALPKIQRIRKNDFVYCKIMAWEGAFGVVPSEADDCVLSNAFVVYRANENILNTNFLGYYFKVRSHWKTIGSQSTGTNVRRQSLHPSQFEKSIIPLPPIVDQRSIVARLDAIAEKARQVETNLDEIEADAAALVISLHHKMANDRIVRLGEVLELHEEIERIEPYSEYPQVGVRGFGGGLFAKPAVSSTDTTYRSFNRLYTDAIVLSQVKGWEGAIARCPEILAGFFVSPEYRTFRCIPGKASPDYVGELIKTPWFWKLLQSATRGVGARRERTRPEQFLAIELPMPDFSDQVKGAEILARLERTKAQHRETRQALKALLPSMLEQIFN